MCQLRSDFDSPVAQGWYRALLVQRMRPVSQDERAEQASHQAEEETGKFSSNWRTATRCIQNQIVPGMECYKV